VDYADLNEQQKELLNDCTKWWLTQYKQTYEISGPAGSGKTSIIELMIERIGLEPHEVLYMAYVGKAAMMLTLRGNIAKTIHASLYDIVYKTLYDEDGNEVIKNNRVVKYKGFERKKFLPPYIKLLVVDEGSMINEQIKNDILSFGLPVIVLGDLNQLPPVFGKPAFLIKPDFILTEVMRQAKNDPIVILSQMAIKGEEIPIGKYGDRCFVIPKEMITDQMLSKADIIICGKNSTRQRMTEYYRQNIIGVKQKDTLVLGEKLICRQNNWNLSIDNGICLINGLIGYVDDMDLESYNRRSIKIDFRPEFKTEEIFEQVEIDYRYLFTDMAEAAKNENIMSKFNNYNKFQFGYVITAHLAQGSQYDNVFVYDERIGDQEYYNKWLYTSITRAVKGLILAKQPVFRSPTKKSNVFDKVA
jgi:exodeoxyribonuclease-5